jgi:hypothetical protein
MMHSWLPTKRKTPKTLECPSGRRAFSQDCGVGRNLYITLAQQWAEKLRAPVKSSASSHQDSRFHDSDFHTVQLHTQDTELSFLFQPILKNRKSIV